MTTNDFSFEFAKPMFKVSVICTTGDCEQPYDTYEIGHYSSFELASEKAAKLVDYTLHKLKRCVKQEIDKGTRKVWVDRPANTTSIYTSENRPIFFRRKTTSRCAFTTLVAEEDFNTPYIEIAIEIETIGLNESNDKSLSAYLDTFRFDTFK